MSLARAFTTKKVKPAQISQPMRSNTVRFPSGTIRHKISAPVELLSTTNMLSYNAPDLYPSSGSSTHSGDESDGVPSLAHSPSTLSARSTDGSTPGSPEPNHLSCYFGVKGRESTSSSEDAPIIPQRALSHTKKTHEVLAHKRSVSRMSSQRKASVNSFARTSIDMFGANPILEDVHPFGNELAQVTELAEEYSGSIHIIDEEEQELESLGLCRFAADDYLSEIQPLFHRAFGESHAPAMWI